MPVAELPWAEELGLTRTTEQCFSSQRVCFASTTEKLHKAHLMGLAKGQKQTMKGLWHPLVEMLPQRDGTEEKAETKEQRQKQFLH